MSLETRSPTLPSLPPRLPRTRRPRPRATGPIPVRRSPLRRRVDMAPATALAAVCALTGLAAAIRLALPRGLWLDEAISVHQAHLGLATLVQDLAQTDRHPPLYPLALWATVHLGGTSDFAVRLPSIAAGTLVVPALYALGRELYDRRTAVLAAALGTLSPLLVWYSQEARMYAFVTLFAVLTVLGCARVLRRGRAVDWALYALAATLLVWSHWFAALLVAATQLAFAARTVRHGPEPRFLLGWGASLAVLAWQLVGLGVLAVRQVEASGAGGGYAGAGGEGSGVSFYTLTANLTWLLGGFQPPRVTQLLSAVWPLGMLGALVALGRRVDRATLLLAGCALAPPLALLAWGAFNPAVFEVRYLIGSAPLVVLLVARLVMLAPARAPRALAATATVALLGVALAVQQLDGSNPRRYDQREAIAAAQRAMGPRDVLLYAPAELGYVIERYAPGLAARPLDGLLPTRREAPQVVVLASFLDQPRYRRVVDRQIGALRYARRQRPIAGEPGVRLWRFT